MNVILIEERAYERMKHRIGELTELVAALSQKLSKPQPGH